MSTISREPSGALSTQNLERKHSGIIMLDDVPGSSSGNPGSNVGSTRGSVPKLEKVEEDSVGSDEVQDTEAHKLNMVQACALNTLNMFGTGPFITIPFLIAATDPPGPQALIGYAMAAIVCINDAYVWGELGSIFPRSGGSYMYLRETFGRHSWGQLMAFLFCWQQIISGPLEIASGFIAMSQYLAYITGFNLWWQHSLIGLAFCVVSVILLWRGTGDVGNTTVALWVGTILAIVFTLIAGFIHFNPDNLKAPPDAFSDGFKLFWSFGVAMRIGIYDFMFFKCR